MATDHLPEDPRRKSPGDNQVVPGSGGKSSQILSLSQTGGREFGNHGVARRDSKSGPGNADLRLSSDHSGVAATEAGGESQAGVANNAPGQLAVLRRRAFVRTTDSQHQLPVYPNLARDLKVSGLNQLWVADITYIRLLLEFVYLAVILDAFSRRVIGWALGRTLEADLAVSALRMAIAGGRVEPGLVHHSDRGVQYASLAYTELLTEHGIRISMSRRGNPYDNAQAESFMKTLKYEEVYRTEYLDFADARRQIGQFIDGVYNQKRLHSALGYRPPVEFERHLEAQMKLPVGQT